MARFSLAKTLSEYDGPGGRGISDSSIGSGSGLVATTGVGGPEACPFGPSGTLTCWLCTAVLVWPLTSVKDEPVIMVTVILAPGWAQ